MMDMFSIHSQVTDSQMELTDIGGSTSMNASAIYNNAVCAYVVFALHRLKILDVLYEHRGNTVGIDKILSMTDLDELKMAQILKYACYFNLISKVNEEYEITELGMDVWQNSGFFTWLLGGYNELLINMDKLVSEANVNWKPFVNGRYVALGSQECNQKFMQHIIDGLLENIEFRYMADLGCGDAGKLIYYAKRYEHLTALGVDISPDAVKVAEENVRHNKLEDRIKIVCEDAFSTISNSQHPGVDVVTCFMMFHDLMNIDGLERTVFQKLRSTFPDMKYFVLGDTFGIDINNHNKNGDIFVTGFELTHMLRGITLFNSSYYEGIFAANNVTVIRKEYLGVPNTYVYLMEM